MSAAIDWDAAEVSDRTEMDIAHPDPGDSLDLTHPEKGLSEQLLAIGRDCASHRMTRPLAGFRMMKS